MTTAVYRDAKQRLIDEPKTWLVTGAAGFIGSHLAEALLKLGQTVVGLDNFATGYRENLDDLLTRVPNAASFRLIEGSVCDVGICRQALEGVDIVLHQAALGSVPRSMEDPLSSHQANVDGFVNLIVAARDHQLERFVYASSSSVYGDDTSPEKLESRRGHPLSPYAATKVIDEVYADVFNRTFGLSTVGLRYFNVFGPRQDPRGAYAAVIPRWTKRLLEHERCVLFGDGNKSRDFCYVQNVVQANILAAMAPEAALVERVFNVGCGARTTLTELFDLLRAQVAKGQTTASSNDPAEGLLHEAAQPGDVPHSLASIQRAREQLGYQPTHDIQEGLEETVHWFRTATHPHAAPARERVPAASSGLTSQTPLSVR